MGKKENFPIFKEIISNGRLLYIKIDEQVGGLSANNTGKWYGNDRAGISSYRTINAVHY